MLEEIRQPKYSSVSLGNKQDAYLAGAGQYRYVICYPDHLAQGAKNVGVYDVGNCIGVIGWDSETQRTYVHHIENKGATGLETEPDVTVKIMLSGLRAGLASFLEDVPMSRYRFTLISQYCFEPAMEAMVTELKEKGIEDISIDRATDRIMIEVDSGELCKEFDPEESVFKSEGQKRAEEARKAQQDAALAAQREFSSQTAEEKLRILESKTVVAFVGDHTLRIMLENSKDVDCLEPEVIRDIIQHASDNKGTTNVTVTLSPPSGVMTYQSKVGDVIRSLSECPKIKGLEIIPSTKESFSSMYAKPAAEALETSGIHLESIKVAANSKGAEMFVDSIWKLKQAGTLSKYALTPILGAWKQEVQAHYVEKLEPQNMRRRPSGEIQTRDVQPVLEEGQKSVGGRPGSS